MRQQSHSGSRKNSWRLDSGPGVEHHIRGGTGLPGRGDIDIVTVRENLPHFFLHVNCSSTYMYMPALNCCIYTYKFIAIIMKSTKDRVANSTDFPGISRFI